MSRAAITVENLSKAYHIGLKEDRADTLVGALQGLVRKPLAQLRHMRRMNTFKHQDEAEDIFWALKDVSFEVAEGEVVGIIGRNGAGKSTLLKILSRITEPTSGRATIRGRVSSLLEVGTGFHQELSGRENVYMNGTILGMTKREIDRKFDEIVAFSGVEKFLDTAIKHYSSGMKVRLAFAVAAHLEPEILIIDEVLAVGDAEFQAKCLGKMQDISRGGRTVLFVSHNMAAVRSLCSRSILIKQGTIGEIGRTCDVIDGYLSGEVNCSTGEVELDTLPRREPYGERLRIRKATLNDGKPIVHGEPLVVELAFSNDCALLDVAFAFGFSYSEGVRVLSADSDVPGTRVDLLPTVNGVVRASLSTLHIEPGTYHIDIGARSGNNAGLDYLPCCMSVTVVPGSNTPDVIAMRTGMNGGVRFPSNWKVTHGDKTESTEPVVNGASL